MTESDDELRAKMNAVYHEGFKAGIEMTVFSVNDIAEIMTNNGIAHSIGYMLKLLEETLKKVVAQNAKANLPAQEKTDEL